MPFSSNDSENANHLSLLKSYYLNHLLDNNAFFILQITIGKRPALTQQMVYISKFNNSNKCFPIKFENVPIGLNTWEQVSTSFCHVHYCWHMTHLFHRYRRSFLECFCLYSIVIYLLITKTVFRNIVEYEAFLPIYAVYQCWMVVWSLYSKLWDE